MVIKAINRFYQKIATKIYIKWRRPMREEPRHTLRVYDERVEIEGKLTIREAFDFLNYFDQLGFTTLEPNYDNDTLTLSKRDPIKEERIKLIEESISDNKFYERLYNQSKDQIEKHEIRIKQLDSLIREQMVCGQTKDELIKDLRNELSKFKALLRLEQAYKNGELNVGHDDEGSNGETERTTGIEDSCESETKSN